MDRRKFGLGLLALGGTACIPAVALSLANKNSNKVQDFIGVLRYCKENYPFHSVYFNLHDIASLANSDVKYTEQNIAYVKVDDSNENLMSFFRQDFGFSSKVPKGWAHITAYDDTYDAIAPSGRQFIQPYEQISEHRKRCLKFLEYSMNLEQKYIYTIGSESLIDVSMGRLLNGYFI